MASKLAPTLDLHIHKTLVGASLLAITACQAVRLSGSVS